MLGLDSKIWKRVRWLIVAATTLLVFQAVVRCLDSDAEPRDAAAADRRPISGRPPRTDRRLERTPESTVEGVVSSSDGPIGGAVVSITPSDGSRPHLARTDASGRFEVTVSPGTYSVAATAVGHVPTVIHDVDAPTDTRVDVELHLRGGGYPIRGTVSDVTGGEIDEAMVRLVRASGLHAPAAEGFATMSGEDGAYELFALPGRYRMEVSHPDYASTAKTIELGTSEKRHDVSLVPMASIEGVVVDRSGEPVASAIVRLSRTRIVMVAAGERMASVGGIQLAESDADGRFRLRRLSPGTHQLSAAAAGLASVNPMSISVALAEQVSGVKIVLDDAEDIRGHVVLAGSDVPVPGATLELGTNIHRLVTASSGQDGSFVLRGVRPGRAALSADADGFSPIQAIQWLDVTPQLGDVRVEMEPARMIRGRVDPPGPAEVSIELTGDSPEFAQASFASGARTTRANERGEFEIGPVLPGRNLVVARDSAGNAGELTVDVGPEGAEGVVVELVPSAGMHGRVVATDGTPLGQATLWIREAQTGDSRIEAVIGGRDMLAVSAVTADDGSFHVDGLAGAWHSVRVTDARGFEVPIVRGLEQRGGSKAQLGLMLEDGQQHPTDLVVKANTGVVSGTVFSEGSRIPDAWVHVTRIPETKLQRELLESDATSGNGSLPPMLTDDRGRFRASGLPDGTYEIRAAGPGGRTRATAVAAPGDNVTLELAAPGAIKGTISAGQTLASSLTLTLAGPTPGTRTILPKDPTFHVEDLESGRYEIRVKGQTGEAAASVEVAANETTTVSLNLEALATVRGRAVDSGGSSLAGARILVGKGEGASFVAKLTPGELPVTTGSDGRFEVECPPGTHTLVVADPENLFPLVTTRITVAAGETSDLGELSGSG